MHGIDELAPFRVGGDLNTSGPGLDLGPGISQCEDWEYGFQRLEDEQMIQPPIYASFFIRFIDRDQNLVEFSPDENLSLDPINRRATLAC
jgi:hypothetical protein